ncbi:MAG: hypothetical protein HKN87_22085 [Saprospiraceae bacterium]|nr:hypothetical protein [Saprospiraceae bacterium]
MIDFNETNKTATEVSLLRSGKAISFNQEDGTVKFTVPELKDFEVVAMR